MTFTTFKHPLLLLLLCATGFCSCGEAPQPQEAPPAAATPAPLQPFEWLIGTWRNQNPDGTYYEIWQHSTAQRFTGKGFILNGTDTLFSERLVLEARGSEVYYSPTIDKQNQGQPVDFALVGRPSDSLVFENNAHDFPKRIVYSRIGNDSLLARIEGEDGGKFRQEFFPMRRVQP